MPRISALFFFTKLLLFLLCLLGNKNLWAQDNITDLKQALETAASDADKIKLYAQLASINMLQDKDSVLYYMDRTLMLAKQKQPQDQSNILLAFNAIKKVAIIAGRSNRYDIHNKGFKKLKRFSIAIKNDSLLASSLFGITMHLSVTGKFNDALVASQEMQALIKTLSISPDQQTSVDNLIADIHLRLGNNKKAIDLLLKALKISEQHDLKGKIFTGVKGLSSIYLSLQNFEKALFYAHKEVSIAQEMQHILRLSLAHMDLGKVYLKKENSTEYTETDIFEAKKHTQLALNYALEANNIGLAGVCYLNFSACYSSLEQLDSSAFFCQQALSIFQKIGDLDNEIRSYTQLAHVSYQQALTLKNKTSIEHQEKIEEVITYGEFAYKNAQQQGSFIPQKKSAENLLRAYIQNKQPEKALYYLQVVEKLKDSLYQTEQIKVIEDLGAKYQTEKKNLEIKTLNQEKAIQQTYLYGGGLFLALVLLFAGILYRLFSQKQKANLVLESQNNLIAQQNDEKEILLKEIHHRVKNNLQIISSLLDLQSSKIEDTTAISAIEDGQSRVKSMALIHHKLYQNENIATIDFKDYIEQLLHQIVSMFDFKNVQKNIQIPTGTAFDIDTAIPLGLLLNELFTNACKYAFSKDQLNPIDVHLTVISKGFYQLDIKDYGPGMPPDFEIKKAKSLGLRLVRRLSKQLLGKVSYSNNKGAHFSIQFKDSTLRKMID